MCRQTIVLSVLGWSNSGKTTFIEASLRECARRGVRAACIKKSRHEADIPEDAKDSSRFFAAGADPSIYLGETASLTLSPPLAGPFDADSVGALCPAAEIVFCEGLAVRGAPLVLVAGSAETEEGLKRPLSEADFLISEAPALLRAAKAAGIPAFSPGEAPLCVDQFLKWRKP